MLVVDLIRNKCPNCRKGKVYQKNNIASFGKDEMNAECPVCHTDFAKDPGFYWGSMYVSYALAMIEVVLAYFICRLAGSEKYDYINLIAAIVAIIICSPLNFRLSRLVWLYIFPNK